MFKRGRKNERKKERIVRESGCVCRQGRGS